MFKIAYLVCPLGWIKAPQGKGWSRNVGVVPDFTTILGPLFWDSLSLGLLSYHFLLLLLLLLQ
jgi:hypothetical protein